MLSGAASGHITGWRMPLSPVHRCGKRRVWLAELLEEFAAMWTERVFFHFSAAPCALLLGYLGHSSTRNSLRNWCHGFFHRSCHCESTARLSSELGASFQKCLGNMRIQRIGGGRMIFMIFVRASRGSWTSRSLCRWKPSSAWRRGVGIHYKAALKRFVAKPRTEVAVGPNFNWQQEAENSP